jgi:hypothetical protein
VRGTAAARRRPPPHMASRGSAPPPQASRSASRALSMAARLIVQVTGALFTVEISPFRASKNQKPGHLDKTALAIPRYDKALSPPASSSRRAEFVRTGLRPLSGRAQTRFKGLLCASS